MRISKYSFNYDPTQKHFKTPTIYPVEDAFFRCKLLHFSPRNPVVYRYCNTNLLRFELQEDRLIISRRIEETTIHYTIRYSITKYGKRRNMIYTSDPFIDHAVVMPKLSCIERATYQGKYQTVTIPMRKRKYTHGSIYLVGHCFMYHMNKEYIRPRIDGNGFTQLKCNGGIIRVHKKTLSDELEYFKQLFDNNKHQSYYHINVDFVDMMEVIFVLNPINKPIRNGLTYGAIYRVSQQMKCLKLAAMCENFIEKIRQRRPLDASFLAYEGGIECESKLFLVAKQSDIRLEQQFRNQRGRGSREVIKECSHREL